ncbi:hypothetical protein BXZ70DRAFT_1006572 [Cristinia sonorae]|uniref:Uncharacterized protein n=1 Tax=Cristinia sonorae TaxID=1940300 RepID=A0A8K0XS75_9AGAR|nr:hypothetical protein BXZ70DRAFT_1006572 [Cristinia sonorae]
MAEFIQALDPSKLLLAESVLSFATTPFTAPLYNFPLFLFGVYAQENQEANDSLKLFSGFTAVSVLFDIIWMSNNTQHWFIRTFTVIIMLLKFPTALACLALLRQRGAQFSGLGSFRAHDAAGATVWSMPGGFASNGDRDGYQTVDEPPLSTSPRPHVPPSAPAPTTQPNAPGAYQSV